MANTYFDFKEFRVEQSDCANKISTDACVFGAWMARVISGGRVLDIGTGTGLLALMLAQGKADKIDGVEIEACCAKQAEQNVKKSKFREKVNIICTDARSFEMAVKYDYIISNPPFFNNTYQNTDSKKTQARQTESLGPKDWIKILDLNSKEGTLVALLLSNNEVLIEYEDILESAGYSLKKIFLFDHAEAKCKRVILFACREEKSLDIPNRFDYKAQHGDYTEKMKGLLKDFYLHL